MLWLGLLGEYFQPLPRTIEEIKLTHSVPYSVLCSEMAVKLIDEPFVSEADNKGEWAL